MTRRLVLRAAPLFLGLCLIPTPVNSQPPQTPARVGVLAQGPRGPLVEVVVERLGELGWRERQNLTIEHRHTEGRFEVQRFREIAEDLAARRMDVILAMQPYALIGAREATRTIPIVAVDLEHDPIASGFVASLARPGGNVTGIFLDQADLAGKHVQLLREAVPALARLAVLWDGNVSALQFKAIDNAARSLGVIVQSFEVRSREGLDPAFAAIARKRPSAVAVVSSPLVWSERARIARYTLEQRLPAISLFDDFPKLGGLLAYGPASWPDLYRSAATLVDRILRGAKPGETPVDRPARFHIVVNANTARAIGLNLPPSVLARADRIIE